MARAHHQAATDDRAQRYLAVNVRAARTIASVKIKALLLDKPWTRIRQPPAPITFLPRVAAEDTTIGRTTGGSQNRARGSLSGWPNQIGDDLSGGHHARESCPRM